MVFHLAYETLLLNRGKNVLSLNTKCTMPQAHVQDFQDALPYVGLPVAPVATPCARTVKTTSGNPRPTLNDFLFLVAIPAPFRFRIPLYPKPQAASAVCTTFGPQTFHYGERWLCRELLSRGRSASLMTFEAKKSTAIERRRIGLCLRYYYVSNYTPLQILQKSRTFLP